jgi:hypothetical protein
MRAAPPSGMSAIIAAKKSMQSATIAQKMPDAPDGLCKRGAFQCHRRQTEVVQKQICNADEEEEKEHCSEERQDCEDESDRVLQLAVAEGGAGTVDELKDDGNKNR